MSRALFIPLIVVFFVSDIFGQANFDVLPSACKNENLILKNTSVNAVSYKWDFCQDALFNSTFANSVMTVPSGAIPVGLTVEYSKNKWYGFVCNREDSKLYRLDFGTDYGSIPTVVNLGDFTFLNGPSEIALYNENGNWYGLVVNYYGNNLVRLAFGNDLGNLPTASNLGNLGTWAQLYGADIVVDGGNVRVLVTSNTNNSISVINFGSSITNNPAASDVLTFSDPLISSPIKIKAKLQNSSWFAFMTSQTNNKILRLSFGSTLLNTPTFTSVADVSLAEGLEFVQDGNNNVALATSQSGSLYRINFGTDLSSSPVNQSLGNFGLLGPTFGISLVKTWPGFSLYTIDVISRNVYRLDFSDGCVDASLKSSTDFEPGGFEYNTAGNKIVELAAFDASGDITTSAKSITVQNLDAPQIAMTVDGMCVVNPVSFDSFSTDGSVLNSWSWDFDDNTTSSSPSPGHQYAIAGQYTVTFQATISNLCLNTITKTVMVYNKPLADFQLPTQNPVCTNQPLVFLNTSTFDAGSNPTWQWSVNGTNVATTQDLNYLIPTTVAQNIILTASIPGCSSQSTQNIPTVQEGPLVNFSSPATGCVNTPVAFANTSTGTITSFNWNFGDGNTSTQTNASNSYASTGTFPVTLTASNLSGCQNFLKKSFPVYSNPQPDFAIEPPPYSCANYPAQFDNNTPAPTDSNITSWTWSFGDAANGTSNQKNPAYTYAAALNYNVTLQAISNFGCTAAKQKSVIINPSPIAGFTNTPACVDQNTIFTNASSGNIVSYQWVIQSTTFIGASPPPYVFKSAGSYPVSLTTTSGNGCKNQVVKNISVPIPPLMDFIYASPCADKPTIFQEANPGGSDPSVVWNWNFGSGSGIGSPTSYTFTAAGGYSVTLSATRTSGCVYSTSKNVAIYEAPIAKFTPSTQGGAPPLTVTFNNESQADSYFWEFDSGNSTSTEFSPVHIYNGFGEYKALLKASNVHGCADTASTKIYVVIPEVDVAMKNFSLIEDPSSNSSKPLVTILNLGNIPLTNPEVEIDLGGNARLKEKIMSTILPGKSLQQLLSLEIVSQSLGYICAEVSPTNDINIYNDRQCLSMTDNDVLFSPYPNPASGTINFDWISSDTENVVVTIFKSTGQVAFQQNFPLIQSGINQLAIDISSLSSGLYLVQFAGAKTKKTFNVMVIN